MPVPMLAFLVNEFGWIIIGLVMLLLFGNRLPSVMRSLGSGVKEFKKGIAEGDADEEKTTNSSSGEKS